MRSPWRQLALVVLLLAACGAPRGAREPEPPAWWEHAALDARTREFVRGWSPWSSEFPFDVTLSRPLGPSELAKLASDQVRLEGEGLSLRAHAPPGRVQSLLEIDAVASVTCAQPALPPPATDAWRQRVDHFAIMAYQEGVCWMGGLARLDRPLDDERRAALAAIGVRASSENADIVGLQLPRDALPALGSLPFVVRFEVGGPIHTTGERDAAE